MSDGAWQFGGPGVSERGMFRSRRLLDTAEILCVCQNCGNEDGTIVPAHSNLSEHGKGKGLKAHDCFFAALCNRCHRWLDNQGGSGLDPTGRYSSSPPDKREMFCRAMHATWLWLWRNARVRVA